MNTIERLAELEVGILAAKEEAENNPLLEQNKDSNGNLLSPEDESNIVSKYAAKKLAQLEVVKNSKKIKNASSVSTTESSLHKKVSRNLLLSLRNTNATVVCPLTGVVSILNVPAIPGKVLEYLSPIADYSNCRGIAQEGYDYLNRLDTQILSGIFIVLATEYDLLRYMPSATGAENNAILRTAGKEKLIQAVLLIESFVNSGNSSFLPRLSLIYDSILRESGIEPRFTEWMKLVNESLAEPDYSEYDENAMLEKPMRGIKELRKAYKEEQKKAKVTKQADPLRKERAQYRKDMIEAKGLLKGLSGFASQKLIGFLGNLLNENVFLTVDTMMIGQVIAKVEEVNVKSAKRLVEILKADRTALRKANSIDDLDDILYQPTDKEAPEVPQEQNANEEQSVEDAFIKTETVEVDTSKMPEGLSMVEKILWKKKQKLEQFGGSI